MIGKRYLVDRGDLDRFIDARLRERAQPVLHSSYLRSRSGIIFWCAGAIDYRDGNSLSRTTSTRRLTNRSGLLGTTSHQPSPSPSSVRTQRNHGGSCP
jgi:hypothetical protein